VRDRRLGIALAAAAAAVALAVGLLVGPADLSGRGGTDVLLKIRLPRTLLAFAAGAALALSGMLSQLTLQNPLADPYLLGIASGATLGAVGSIGFFGASRGVVSAAAFAGGSLGLLLTFAASGRRRRFDPPTLVLAGAVVSFFLSALALLALAFARAPDLPGILFWIAGDCSMAEMGDVVRVVAASLPALAVAMLFSRELALLSGGEEEARSLGVPSRPVILLSLLAATVAATTCVATVGTIGFVGLMIPHAARALMGSSVRAGAAGACLLGGAVLAAADAAARNLLPFGELPVGSITALLGCPVFLWLLRRGSMT
jgi:iron complex transport system permease protein